MNIFLDTSSVLKLYHRENGSDELILFIQNKASKIFLSELTTLEFSSAIWKKSELENWILATAITFQNKIDCFITHDKLLDSIFRAEKLPTSFKI